MLLLLMIVTDAAGLVVEKVLQRLTAARRLGGGARCRGTAAVAVGGLHFQLLAQLRVVVQIEIKIPSDGGNGDGIGHGCGNGIGQPGGYVIHVDRR